MNSRTEWSRLRRRGRATTLLMLLAMLLPVQLSLSLPLAHPTSVAARETATIPGEADPFVDVLPGALAAAERAADELSAISMDVAFDPEMGTIGGEMIVTWRNPASEPLADVWFRLFPNAFYYGEGSLVVTDLTVDGAPVTPRAHARRHRAGRDAAGAGGARRERRDRAVLHHDGACRHHRLLRHLQPRHGQWLLGPGRLVPGPRGLRRGGWLGACRRPPPLAIRRTRRAPSTTCR